MRVAQVSFRLGGVDGVSIEAAKWANALRSLGHEVVTVAGDGPVERRLYGLAIGAVDPPSADELARALTDVDLVIVENLLSLPLNPGAAAVCAEVIVDRPAILHHHDLAWQRAHLAHVEGPPDDPHWRHVTINERSAAELAERGIAATTIYNAFDCDPPFGDRARTRAALSLHDEPLVLFPSRAIARKNVAGALELAEALHAVLWLLGPPEDGYDDELASLLAASPVEVRRGPVGSIHDAYAACDLVVLPSTWEGFGNATIESVTHRKPLAVYPYPVLAELSARGLSFFDLEDLEGIAACLEHADVTRLEHHLEVARAHFNLADLPARLATLLDDVRDH
ncbi:MAG: glycosyltransferase family 4 protein [Acidimicrobiales bacterium]